MTMKRTPLQTTPTMVAALLVVMAEMIIIVLPTTNIHPTLSYKFHRLIDYLY
jgi:hypothetical protein